MLPACLLLTPASHLFPHPLPCPSQSTCDCHKGNGSFWIWRQWTHQRVKKNFCLLKQEYTSTLIQDTLVYRSILVECEQEKNAYYYASSVARTLPVPLPVLLEMATRGWMQCLSCSLGYRKKNKKDFACIIFWLHTSSSIKHATQKQSYLFKINSFLYQASRPKVTEPHVLPKASVCFPEGSWGFMLLSAPRGASICSSALILSDCRSIYSKPLPEPAVPLGQQYHLPDISPSSKGLLTDPITCGMQWEGSLLFLSFSASLSTPPLASASI